MSEKVSWFSALAIAVFAGSITYGLGELYLYAISR